MQWSAILSSYCNFLIIQFPVLQIKRYRLQHLFHVSRLCLCNPPSGICWRCSAWRKSHWIAEETRNGGFSGNLVPDWKGKSCWVAFRFKYRF